ncbi:hypothetical protein L218DRAFT_1080383 [Marasmius fiardii PR-910]|nr:hypothetical protein L218DRAFT_1080383 [Marasmius fiardii PR-910]
MVSAQRPSPCVMDCSNTAAKQNGCTGAADLRCVCSNQAFQRAALQCIQAKCPQDVAAARNLQAAHCK